MSTINFLTEIVLHKHDVEQQEVISSLLFFFVTSKLKEHLVGTVS